jgi:hypothetical protein
MLTVQRDDFITGAFFGNAAFWFSVKLPGTLAC